MNVLVAVADLGLRALWEGILTDHGHRTLPVSPDLPEWREAHTFALDLAIVELSPSRPEALELCRRLRMGPPESRPDLLVLVQPADATDMLVSLRTTPDDVVLGHPGRRTAVSHLAALERRRRVARPTLPTAHELATGSERTARVASEGISPLSENPPPSFRNPVPTRPEIPEPPSLSAARTPALILLIDDEPSVRHPLRLALQHAGYRVIEAIDGEEGLEVIARRGDDIALVVTDQRMGRISGLEILRQVRRRARRIPVVLLSGYPSLTPPDGMEGPDVYLRKPFELLDLARTVQRLIGGEAGRT
jgi:DNA-binding response OmpR family regulator